MASRHEYVPLEENGAPSLVMGSGGNNHCWMSSISRIHQARVGEVVWPGSHDSGAYCVDFDYSKVVSSDWLRRLGTFLINWPAGCTKQFASAWSQTQAMSIKDQLVHGVRFLDLRVAKCPSDGRYYIVHSFCGPALEDVLQQIHDFANRNDQEVILIEVVPCSYVDHMELYQIIHQNLRGLLLERRAGETTSPCSLPLSHLLENGRILLLYRSPAYHLYKANAPALWDANCLSAHWELSLSPEKRELVQMREFEEFCNYYHRSEVHRYTRLFHLKYALTPSLREILGSGFGRLRSEHGATVQSLKDCSVLINPRLSQFIDILMMDCDDALDVGMIVSLDFVHDSELMELAIRLNGKKFE